MKFRNIIIALLVIVNISVPVTAASKYTYADNNIRYIEELPDSVLYKDYLRNHNGMYPDAIVEPDIRLATFENMPSGEYVQDYNGRPALKTGENGSFSIPFTVLSEGFYNLMFSYSQLPGTGADVERHIYIDGILPFKESANVIFERIWKNDGFNKKDKNGNQIKPKLVESNEWILKYITDGPGVQKEPLQYWLSKGNHTLSVVSYEEPVAISTVQFTPIKKSISYSEYLNLNQIKKFNQMIPKKEIYIEGEDATLRSGPTLYPLSERSTPAVTPNDANRICYNTIGGTGWSKPGEWIEWDIEVPQDGIYNIVINWKQDIKTNSYVTKRLSVDGEIPFAEAGNIKFTYKENWSATAIGNGLRFFLTAGTHKIRLTSNIGDFDTIVQTVENSITELNVLYRKIVAITGSNPDKNRDYQFETVIPDVINGFSKQRSKIDVIIQQMNNMKSNGYSTSVLRKLSVLLKNMVINPPAIAFHLVDFRNTISQLGSWSKQIQEQPLTIDYIKLVPDNSKFNQPDNSVWSNLKFSILQFVNSFFEDYSSLEDETDGKVNDKITVWLGAGGGLLAGRDQSQLLRNMIDGQFTPNKKIKVNLQLVAAGSLLPSTLAGIGPDVSLQMAQSEPLNYGLRGAAQDLSGFDGYNDVIRRFHEETTIPFTFEKKVYALPETLTFPMLFYRTDILEEIGINKNLLNTWEGVVMGILPILQKNYLGFGLTANINSYLMLLYQNKGSLYTKDLQKSNLNNEIGIKSYEDYTSLYSDYKLPLAFDFINRFRSGEMPIAISDYTAFNQLSVFAPEIAGRWGMLPVPGTVDENGKLDRSTVGTVVGAMMMSQAKNKKSAWEFLKWWTSDDTQSTYGKEIEYLLGIAGRYPTANINVIKSLSWDKATRENLNYQLSYLKAFPEVPGGYLTGRSFDFSFRNIVLNNYDLRESMTFMTKSINNELANKRKEFGLKTSD